MIRSTFLIGADGKIVRAWYHVKADGHADEGPGRARGLSARRGRVARGTRRSAGHHRVGRSARPTWWGGHHQEVRPPTVDRVSSAPSRGHGPRGALVHQVTEVGAASRSGRRGSGPGAGAGVAPRPASGSRPVGAGERPARHSTSSAIRLPMPATRDWSSSRALSGAVDASRMPASSAGVTARRRARGGDTSGSRQHATEPPGVVDHQATRRRRSRTVQPVPGRVAARRRVEQLARRPERRRRAGMPVIPKRMPDDRDRRRRRGGGACRSAGPRRTGRPTSARLEAAAGGRALQEPRRRATRPRRWSGPRARSRPVRR